MNYKNENNDMQVKGIISNPFVAQDILKQLKALIEKHWGKDPVYCPGSRNKEEASAANVCCEIPIAAILDAGASPPLPTGWTNSNVTMCPICVALTKKR